LRECLANVRLIDKTREDDTIAHAEHVGEPLAMVSLVSISEDLEARVEILRQHCDRANQAINVLLFHDAAEKHDAIARAWCEVSLILVHVETAGDREHPLHRGVLLEVLGRSPSWRGHALGTTKRSVCGRPRHPDSGAQYEL